MIDIPTMFDKTMKSLKEGKRPQHNFSHEEFKELSTMAQESLHPWDFDRVLQILCLLDYAGKLSSDFDSFLETVLASTETSDELKIYGLSAAQKHIIKRCFLKGERVPGSFLICLEKMINANPTTELFLWILKTIEQLGTENFFFKKSLLPKKSLLKGLWDKEWRQCQFIITELEKKWSVYDKRR